jgi:RND family efflux transporter MFP subunit
MHFRLLASLAAVLALAAGCSSKQAPQAPPPAAVTVANPLQREVRDWDDYVGRFEAINTIEIKPRVTGYLQAVHFRDGDFVRAGQLLFTIDPRPAQAQLDQARAQLAKAEAALVNARTELARSRTLAASRAASKEEVEQRLAALRSGEADVAAGRANVRAQALTLGFTRVTAPISGRISQRRVDPGNAVTADQTVLTTVVSTDPLHFAFDGSEALLLRYQRQGAGQLGSEVRIRLQDEGQYVHAGRLDFVDNAIDPGAGTIHARAIVPNPDGFLKPGMVGHLQLAGSPPYEALLVPDTAVATDAVRRIVYVADRAGNVTPHPVVLGPLVGNLRVIRSGIAARDLVVIDGLQRIVPGGKVAPHRGNIPPPTGAQAPTMAPQPAPASVATPVQNGR